MNDLRTLENDSIRAFVQTAADDGYLSGRVLDFGCGRQPYREIIEAAGGDYHAYDSPDFPASVATELHIPRWPHRYDAILCSQVIQYVPKPATVLNQIRRDLTPVPRTGETGHLVLTYPTCWPEVEPEDLHRFTKAGMEHLLTESGFTIIRHDWRAGFRHNGDSFTLGYGVIARA